MANVSESPPILMTSSVAALIPHYNCQKWLRDCLESLVAQTRPLQGIIVIDDGSLEPPKNIAEQFPQVTLLASSENVGPYRLIQEVINSTDFDAYLFNDADDWSSRERLDTLLADAERTGAELVGSQEVRILCNESDSVLRSFPVDVNQALSEYPHCFPLLHGTSLVARHLVRRIGGYSTGMRFGGDAEFLRRATHAARIINSPKFCYFRRIRSGALTVAPETGLQSPGRIRLQNILRERALSNAKRVAAGDKPDLKPYKSASPIALMHVAGPILISSLEKWQAKRS
jgi:glycosyltransferase involved in cell wall biosynthesis